MGDRIVVIYHESQKSALGSVDDFEYNEETDVVLCELRGLYTLANLLTIHDAYAIEPGKIIFVYLTGMNTLCIRIEEWIRGRFGICIAPHKDAHRYPRGVICTRIDPLLIAYVTMIAWQHSNSIDVALKVAADAEKLVQ